ncbi:cyclopropane-fatty-acyl-phospholipid synthase family protein, partial [Streptomyces achromogenes]|uniref:cyclopropane-fatty-acyl-phospholipid synthase family protein n=1 Tax=Streptomyces achromogenes TaxID=67255 RepID=UPI0033ED7AB5
PAPPLLGRDHYELSNDFYRLLLDDTMAYSCGYWTGEETEVSPAGAQHAKLELICRKLGLVPGARLLDIGCGWGALTLYAVQEHKAQVTAVTPTREQATYVREQARKQRLKHRVEVVCQDYRDITGSAYDVVATVETGEHVGHDEYPAFAATLHQLVRPRGRVLVQQISRDSDAPGSGAFIKAYIAPDMHMRPVGETVSLLEAAGLEVRSVESLRERYVRTIEAWHDTLEARWAEFVRLAGEETARVWRLYLVGGALAFAERRMGVEQILCVRPTADGDSDITAAEAADWYRDLAGR